ncbi:MAG: sulfurtransferase TusA family protein [Pseudomonadota bacterium]|nr:sulfurtransferase TusA family protein [Pseudomonadota bacterium]
MEKVIRELDARGLRCPLPILKTKKALAEMNPGEQLRVMATDPGSASHWRLCPPIRDTTRHWIRSAADRQRPAAGVPWRR